MLSGKVPRLAALGIAAVLALVAMLYPTDERRVKEVAEKILDAANTSPAELGRALDENASPSLSVSVAELPEPLVGRAALVGALSQAQDFGTKLHFRADAIEIKVEGNRAQLTADLITMPGPEVPELRRPRHSVAVFERRGGRFRLLSAEVGAERLDQPEARP
jgi:hypothetical protein